MTERYRAGWEWRDLGNNNGYWVKVDSKAKHSHSTPLFCPHCKKITGTGGIDDKYLKEYGICAECYVMYVENRKTPAIDLSKYKPS